MKPQNNYRSNRYGYTGTYERNTRTNDSNFQNRYDNNDQNMYNNRFPEDTEGYSDAPGYAGNRDRQRNAYNSDTHRDADAYNYRSSGGYGRQDNYDRSGRYDADSQTYNDRYNMNESSGRWPQDTERRSSRNSDENSRNSGYSDRDGAYGRYNENLDYRNEGYNGRNASDYNSSPYSDRYYDPSEHYNRRDGRGYTYRHDEDLERENHRPEHRGRYSWGRENEDRSAAKYGYYESYPSYGQSESYGDHERYAGKTDRYRSHTDQYGETDSITDYERPNVRDRHSW